jgi:Immune inhibitor A-like, MAM domain
MKTVSALRSLFILLFIVGLVGVVGIVTAQEKPPQAPLPTLTEVSCGLIHVEHDWDFSVSDQGFTTTTCDATGGGAVWAWGATTIPGAPGTVWGTVLAGNYPSNSGEGLLSPSFTVDSLADTMEILTYVHTETNFDGVNVKVHGTPGTLLQPTPAYNATISTSTSFYAFCNDNQPGWTGNSGTGPSQNWVEQCFDLSAYNGQNIQVRFDFGSDSSVTYPGWYIAYVRIGSATVPVELQSFSVDSGSKP